MVAEEAFVNCYLRKLSEAGAEAATEIRSRKKYFRFHNTGIQYLREFAKSHKLRKIKTIEKIKKPNILRTFSEHAISTAAQKLFKRPIFARNLPFSRQ
jgi:hypothetical protein